MSFSYSGRIPASKSMLNRALILSSYFPHLQLIGDSACEDVVYLKQALEVFNQSSESSELNLFAGDGGTTLRFLALRLSRRPGVYNIRGTSRLMARPQSELLQILKQLNVHAEIKGDVLRIESKSWRCQEVLQVSTSESSQFLSALLLNLWNLDFDLRIQKPKSVVSEPYLIMTIKILKDLGFQFYEENGTWVVPKGQVSRAARLECEIDLSSAFAVAAIAALDGSAIFEDFPVYSQQADSVFVSILQRMLVKCNIITARENSSSLIVSKDQLKGLEYSLNKAPDLFPVLSVLCAFAEGTSHLHSAAQLKHKESDRIASTSRLLTLIQVPHECFEDGIKIYGQADLRERLNSLSEFEFDPDHDHRLAMAAGILKHMGAKIKILTPEVVNKSFPEFWQISGVKA